MSTVTLPRAMNAEWIKLRTVRSTVWTVLAFIVLVIGINVLACLGLKSQLDRNDVNGAPEFVAQSLIAGLLFGQLAIGVLGVLVSAGEYGTGMIRATLTAVPRRMEAFAAKLLTFGAAVLVLSFGVLLVSFFAGQAVLGRYGTGLGGEHALRGLLGATGYAVVFALFGVALGFLFRNSAAAIALLVVAVFIAPLVLQFIPGQLPVSIGKFLPLHVLVEVALVHQDSDSFRPLVGLGVFAVEVAVLVAASAVLLQRRDA